MSNASNVAVDKEAINSLAPSKIDMLILAKSGRYPPPIAAMVSTGKGVKVLEVFEAQSGLTGFVLTASNLERRLYYVTPDGAVAIYGMVFDQNLNNLTARDVSKYIAPSTLGSLVGLAGSGAVKEASKPITGLEVLKGSKDLKTRIDSKTEPKVILSSEGAPKKPIEKEIREIWAAPAISSNLSAVDLEKFKLAGTRPVVVDPVDLAWDTASQSKGSFVEGKGMPVYIVFDLACPYCHQTYKLTRKLLDKFEIHWIPMAALGVRSQLLAETFIQSKDKAKALSQAVGGTLEPSQTLSIEVATTINENGNLLRILNSTRVPMILYKEQGKVKNINNAPSTAQLQDLLKISESSGSGSAR